MPSNRDPYRRWRIGRLAEGLLRGRLNADLLREMLLELPSNDARLEVLGRLDICKGCGRDLRRDGERPEVCHCENDD